MEDRAQHLLYYIKRMLEQMLNFVNEEIKDYDNGNNVDKRVDGVG